MAKDESRISNVALKVGIAGAIGFAAIATGLFVSRRGRHLMKEAWEGKRRTRIEDRVLDALWGDAALGRRDIDVDEITEGTIELIGVVRSDEERERALEMARTIKGVGEVLDNLQVFDPHKAERRRLRPPFRR